MTTQFSGIFQFTKVSLLAAAVSLTGCALDQQFSQKSHIEGARLYNAGDYEGAAGAYQYALKKEPRDYKAYYALGCSYDAMKDWQKAVAAYKTSLDVMALTFQGQHDPDFRLKVVDSLGQSIARSDTRQVELNLAEQQAHARHDAEPYFLVAKIYRYSGDADLAIQNYDKANRMAPDNVAMVRELGLYFEQLGQAPRAEPALRRAYALGAHDEQVTAALRRLGTIPGPTIQSPAASPPDTAIPAASTQTPPPR